MDVLKGSLSVESDKRLAGITVCLEHLVETETTFDGTSKHPQKTSALFSTAKQTSTHHDGYLWGDRAPTKGVRGGGEVPTRGFLIALQMRHGGGKTETELDPQEFEAKGAPNKVEKLLVVNQAQQNDFANERMVAVDASRLMTAHSWLFLLSPEKQI